MSSINSWNFYKNLMQNAGVDKINYLGVTDRSMCLAQAQIEARLKEQDKEWKDNPQHSAEVPPPHVFGEPTQIENAKWGTLQNTVPVPQQWTVNGIPAPHYNVINNPLIIDEAVNNQTRAEMEEKLREEIMPLATRQEIEAAAKLATKLVKEKASEEIKEIVEEENNKDLAGDGHIQYMAPPPNYLIEWDSTAGDHMIYHDKRYVDPDEELTVDPTDNTDCTDPTNSEDYENEKR